MTDIKFLNRGKIFKLTQGGQRVEGKHQNFNVLESANKTKFFDLQIGKIGKLKDRWIFNVELFDIKLVPPLKQQILIELIVERTSAEAILEIVDKHHLDRPQIKSVKLIGLDFKIGVISLINTLELV